MFQKTVRFDQAFGLVGDLRFDGPRRAAPYVLGTPGTPAQQLAGNIVGHAFTHTSTPGVVQAGGTGQFAGILANSKVYPYYGTFVDNDPQALYVANGTTGEFVDMALITVLVDKPANVGDLIVFNTTTGKLSVVAKPAAGAEPKIPDGFALVPNTYVDRYPQTDAAGGQVLARLTN